MYWKTTSYASYLTKMRSLTDNILYTSLVRTGLFLLVLSGALFCSSCKGTVQAGAQEQGPGLPLLHFQKTRCYGECPSFQATILNNGTVTFIGNVNVPVTDTITFTLAPEELSSLKTEIENLDYTSLQDLYPTQWTDMPATLTTFYKDGKIVKRIKHLEGGPEALRIFQEKLHQLIWKQLPASDKK